MRYFLADFKRCFMSKWFVLSVIGIAFTYYFSNTKNIHGSLAGMQNVAIIDVFLENIVWGFFSEIIVVLAAIPFAMSFCEDYNNGFIKNLVIREGIKKYSISKAVTCFLGSFIAITLGQVLLMIILSTFMKIGSEQSSAVMLFKTWGSFKELLFQGKYLAYVLIFNMNFALVASIFSLVGLYSTTYIKNKFFAITSPMIVAFTIYQIATSLNAPPHFRLKNFMATSYEIGPDWMNEGYLILVVITTSLIIGYLFYKGVKRNVEG